VVSKRRIAWEALVSSNVPVPEVIAMDKVYSPPSAKSLLNEDVSTEHKLISVTFASNSIQMSVEGRRLMNMRFMVVTSDIPSGRSLAIANSPAMLVIYARSHL
jgi:hypothetical protein